MQAKVITLAALLVALTATGCASQIGTSGKIDAASYAAMSCTELNNAVGANSKQISATAISRGKVSKWKVPFWAPGGDKAVTVIQDRQTARIERLQGEQAAIESVRVNTCRNQM